MADGTGATPKWRDNIMRKTGSAILAIGGIAALGTVIAVNVEHMTGLGHTTAQKLVNASQALIVDVVGICFLTVLGAWLFKNGKYGKSLITYGAVGMAMIFSLQMYYSYSMVTRWAPAQEALLAHEAEVAARAKTQALQEKLIAQQFEYLRAEAAKYDRISRDRSLPRSQREAAREARQAAYDAQTQAAFTAEVRPEPVRKITDPAAEALAADLNLTVSQSQKLAGIYLALTVMIVHIIAMSGAVTVWPSQPSPPKLLVAANDDEGDDDEGDDEEGDDEEVAVQAPAPVTRVPVSEPLAGLLSEGPEEPGEGDDEEGDEEDDEDKQIRDAVGALKKAKQATEPPGASVNRDLVAWMASRTEPCAEGSGFGFAEAYADYTLWAEMTGARHLQEGSFRSSLANVLEPFGMHRKRLGPGSRVHYMGRRLLRVRGQVIAEVVQDLFDEAA